MNKNIGRPTHGESPGAGARPVGSPKLGTIYVTLANVLGLATLAYCIFQFASRPEVDWFWLAALTAVTSSLAIAIPIPGGRAGGVAITVSDCFVFMALLLYGPAAAALTAAIDGIVTGVRVRIKRPERFCFNVAIMALDAYLVATLFNLLAGTAPPVTSLLSAGTLPALGVAAVAYFLFNSLPIALGMSLVAGQRFAQIWKTNFPWASPSLLANVLAALFFMLAFNQPDTASMALMVGLGVVCLALSGLYLLKGRRWRLNSRLVGEA